MTKTSARQLGRSGIKVSAMGLGCWPIGGQMFLDRRDAGAEELYVSLFAQKRSDIEGLKRNGWFSRFHERQKRCD